VHHRRKYFTAFASPVDLVVAVPGAGLALAAVLLGLIALVGGRLLMDVGCGMWDVG
jgi:hypothetical protein